MKQEEMTSRREQYLHYLAFSVVAILALLICGTATAALPDISVVCNVNTDCASTDYCKKAVGDCGGQGICMMRPVTCPLAPVSLNDLVCGCDGQTYGDYIGACDAAMAGVNIFYNSPCSVFNDVSTSNWANKYIYAIYIHGIAQGCGNGNYCPSDNVTRAQMAAFIVRAMFGESFNYTQAPYYTDEPSTDYFFKYVQKMRDLNITITTSNYGPNSNVTRAQMAAFLVRAAQYKAGQDTENFSYTSTPYFSDVPAADPFFKYIQKLKDGGITAVSGTYNANGDVTRDQMAAFISRAFLGIQ